MRARLVVLAALAGCAPNAHGPVNVPVDEGALAPEIVIVSPRTTQMELFPCGRCHDGIEAPADEGRAHRVRLDHMPDVTCNMCHDEGDLEQLRLLSGAPVAFNNSGVLCGQCHFAQQRDWQTGLHGKQVGKWQGEVRHRYACVGCHDAHAPGDYGQMKALPPPPRPRFGVKKNGHH